MLRNYLILCALLGAGHSYCQDTVSVMYYNLLNFPQINSGRITNLQTILQHTQPDILLVCELTSASGANTILANALNTNGITHYYKSNYVDGPDTDRMLYFDSTKFGYITQNEISTSVRDINEFVLYYKDPGLTSGSDTIFLYLYCAHLKAGTTSSDEQERATETQILRNYLNARINPENTIVGGDLNIYGSYEAAYSYLTASTAANLTDPIGAGTYHNNTSYAYVHTQCTRLTSIDGGSTGGMDDRFDYILHAQEVNTGTHGLRYISGSQKVIGQDGLRFNENLINPTNNSEPSNVISALYYMSDHLPVISFFEIDSELGLPKNNTTDFDLIPIANGVVLSLKSHIDALFTIYDIRGKMILTQKLNNQINQAIDLVGRPKGVYIICLESATGLTTRKFVY